MPNEFRGDTNLFGIQVALRSNHHEALREALALFKRWKSSQRPTEAISVLLRAREAEVQLSDRARITGPHLSMVQSGMALRANGRHGLGACAFPARDVNSAGFREAIHTVVLFLVAHAGRTPVHASAVMIGGRAVVLAGKSRSGKSSLAMAADRAGLSVLSEDSVFVQLEPAFRVWGMAQAIHLSAADFPAALGAGELRVRSGRAKRVFPVTHPRKMANKACLCVIARGDAVGLEKIPRHEAVSVLTRAPEPGFDYYGTQFERAIRAIADGGCWRLTLSGNPDAAIATLIDRLGERSG